MKKFGFLLFILLHLPVQAFPADPPNIVILIADDMGWRDASYVGNQIVISPVLNEMANKGIRFDYFYAAGDMCCPGRYGILTGRSPFRGGINGNATIMPREIILPRALKKAGYQSAYFGKWHLGHGASTPFSMGFDEAKWAPEVFDLDPTFRVNDTNQTVAMKGDGSEAVIELTLQTVRSYAAGRTPFLVVVGFSTPHDPHQPGLEFKNLYKALPENESNYWGEITAMDTAIGKLRKELQTLGISENTIVWFTSDNGALGEKHNDDSGKGKAKIGIRVPSLLEWPGRFKTPKLIRVPCGHVDLFPTLLEAAGLPPQTQPIVDGISLMSIVDGTRRMREKPMGFMQLHTASDLTGIDFVKGTLGVWIDGDYKLLVEREGSMERGGPIWLYNIYNDPGEKKNLASQLPNVVQKMREALETWKRSVRSSFEGKDRPTGN